MRSTLANPLCTVAIPVKVKAPAATLLSQNPPSDMEKRISSVQKTLNKYTDKKGKVMA